MSSRLFVRMRGLLRELGWGAAIVHLLDRALAAASAGCVRLRFYRLYSMPVPARPLLARGSGTDWVIREISPGDPLCSGLVRPAAVIAMRFERGSRCIVVARGDEVLAFAWLHVGVYEEDEVDCEFVPMPTGQACWDFDVFVHPQHRVGRMFLRLWEHVFETMRQSGVVASASRISLDNVGSVGAHARLGARPTGVACFLRLGRAQLTIANLSPWVRLSYGRWHRPRIAVPPVASAHESNAITPAERR